MTRDPYDEIVRNWSPEERKCFPRERHFHLPETESTNDVLLEKIRSGGSCPFDLVTTDFQTKGRGRRGDRWEAPAGRNLLFSLAVPLPKNPVHWTRLPLITAYFVGTAIESILEGDRGLQAKWPNDLLFDGKKLLGILVETSSRDNAFAVVGVGINVNLRKEELSLELRETATSLYEIFGCESSRWYLLGLILRNFREESLNGRGSLPEAIEWLTDRDFLRGKSLKIRSGNQWFEGLGNGIGEGGQLLLRDANGSRIEIVSAEEIQGAYR
jgi:BirA family biotin operon repressor/biotin-[acetyl-CoA-carboxylase] ligase